MGAGLVVQLGQAVRAVHGVGVDAGRDRRTRIAGRGQAGVDRRHAGVGDRREPGLRQVALLDVGEEEGTVAHDRSPDAQSVLVLAHGQRAAEEGIGGVEGVVAEELVRAPVEHVGPAAGDDVDVAAEGAAQLGLPARGHHLELVHRFHGQGDAAQARGVVVRGDAVDDEAVGEVALAGHGEALSRNGRGLGEELGARGVGRRHAGHEEREVQEVAAVHGQADHFGRRDRPRDLAARGFDGGGVAGDGDSLFQAADLEGDRNLEGGADVQREGAGKRLEALRPHVDVVRTDLEEGETEAPILFRDGAGLDVRARVARRDLGARDRRALGIRDPAGQARVVDRFLRAGAEGEDGDAERQERGGERSHEVPVRHRPRGGGPSGRSVAREEG